MVLAHEAGKSWKAQPGGKHGAGELDSLAPSVSLDARLPESLAALARWLARVYNQH